MVARLETLPPTLVAAVRGALALALLLAALRLYVPAFPEDGREVLAWFGLTGALGAVLARRRAALLALLALPFSLAGWWYTAATGPEYLWGREGAGMAILGLVVGALLAATLGLLGIALGVGAARGLTTALAAALAVPRAAAERLLLLAALPLVLGGAALDRQHGSAVVSWPRPLEVRRYSEAEVRALAAGLPFALYMATSEGAPHGALRRQAGLPPTEVLTLLYCDDRCRGSSGVQVDSAPPAAARSDVGWVTEVVEIAGVTWELRAGIAPGGLVQGRTGLGDAYVEVMAPDRAVFERVAAGLRRVDR